ncbi:hypothetical protein MY4824_007747 [Beauveria thailandica]
MATSNSDVPRAPALVIHDELPPGDQNLLSQQTAASSATDESEPTQSHALANQTSVNAKQYGLNHREPDYSEVLDLGWNEDDKSKLQPIVQGLENEHLWALLRRFNKQAFRVRRIEQPPLANLDMNIADEEEFSPEKLRAQLERCYVSVVIPLCSAWNHVARLRSWNERNRTLAFFLSYVCAWMLDLVVPTTVLFIIALILAPRVRSVAFPPAPVSVIDSSTGHEQTPAAGFAATDDTLTGAPENVAGEAVEQEAHSFVNTIGSVALSTTIGNPTHDEKNDDSFAPDAEEFIGKVSEAKASAAEGDPTKAHNETRQPASKMVWQRTRPFMHALTDLVDTWERFANALNPTPPFHKSRPKFRLAAPLLPIVLASLYTTPYMLTKMSGFALGFLLFGKPLLDRLIQMLEDTYPRWQHFVELRNSILRGVPTNAQLTITLLRIGEKNKAPIPAPPDPDVVAGKRKPHLKQGEEHISPTSKNALAHQEEAPSDGEQKVTKRPGKGRRALDMLKGTVKGGVSTALAADRVKAFAGDHHAKERVGVIKQSAASPDVGPVRFEARYKGKKGFAYVTETSTTPALSWSRDGDSAAAPAWTVLISDVKAIKKVGGFAWPSKMVIGWSLKKQVVDGLVIETEDGSEYHMTAVLTRDEVFNRLIAMGDQMWQLW